jgi:two-component system, NarL family, response regulator LiaR
MASLPIRVLIVDDHGIVRKGTRALLAEIEDIEVVGEAADGETALSQAQALKPDVILMDLVMPNLDGIEAIRRILAVQSHVRILAMTSFTGDDKVFPAIKAGALGYFLKDAPPEELVDAIHQVYRGQPALPPDIAYRVLQELSRSPQNQSLPTEPLTERELEVLKLVANGLSNQQVADRLAIAEVTVRTHVSNILNKLHLTNRVQATLYALREGLTSLSSQEAGPFE